MDNHATKRLWEESRNNDELMNEIYEMNDQPNSRVMEELRVENEQGDEIVEGSTKKAHRGPTYMHSVWGRPSNLPRFHVEFNEFGQSIDGKDSDLCHFLGSIARNGRYCPIDVMDWRQMPSRKKTDMLDVVKEASKRNKEARAKNMIQITRKRSFAKVQDKLKKKLGRPPHRSELFGACYVKSNENSTNPNEKSSEDALRKYLEMQERN
ncbi:hypothetical protein ACS0TY_035432 [Phlomoides rotata]